MLLESCVRLIAMTPEDLEQMRALLSASEERLLQETRSIVREEVAAIEHRLDEKLDRAVESMISNISDLRSEMVSRFESLDGHNQVADLRMDRIENLASSLNY
jgi:hypothetical protein